MIRIVHSVDSLAPRSGGPARTVSALVDALGSQQDLSVVLLSQARYNDDVVSGASQSQVVRRIARSRSGLALRAGLPIKRLLHSAVREAKPALLHDHGIWLPSNHHAAIAARRLGIPLVIHPRGMLEPWALEYHGWKKRIALTLYQRRDLESAALFIATAEQEAISIRELGLRQPIAVIPNGVARAEPDPARASQSAARQGPRTALFMSRIHPKKGLLNLIDAWRRLRPEDWRLCLAGPDQGGHLEEVIQRVREYGLETSVSYLGEIADANKSALFESVDLFILPTFTENFGVVVAEALAHGLPVITTQRAPWEGLLNHGCGWWIAPTVDALADAIRQALAMDPAALRDMGVEGRKYAREFNWHHIARQTRDAYRWVLGLGPMPECVWAF